jgi:hypothetical protein
MTMEQLQFTKYGWPINPPGVGRGSNTLRKEEEFKAIARCNVALVDNINIGRVARGQKPFPYFVGDPTAGPGCYVDRRPGSPDVSLVGTCLRSALACHEGALKGGYRLGFIEQEPAYVECLNQRLGEMARANKLDRSRVEVIAGCYEELLIPWVKDTIPSYGARGMIVPDPNGEFGFETLRELGTMRCLECVDFAFHVSGGLLKWRKGKGATPLQAALDACNKTHWLIGRVASNWQWAWMFGTNWSSYPELKRAGLVSVLSAEGERRLARLCQTHEERQEEEEERQRRLQPRLLPDEETQLEEETHA